MRRPAVIAAVVALGLAACSRGGLSPEQVQAWVGRPATDLVRAWGAPTREVDDAGQRVMIYEEVERNESLNFEKTVTARAGGERGGGGTSEPGRTGAHSVRPLVPLLGGRRRRHRPRPDPTALIAPARRALGGAGTAR